MFKLIITLTLLSGLSIYPAANSADRPDEEDTKHQLSIIRGQNASATATATASAGPTSTAEFDSKARATLLLTQPVSATSAQTTAQLNRLMQTLDRVFPPIQSASPTQVQTTPQLSQIIEALDAVFTGRRIFASPKKQPLTDLAHSAVILTNLAHSAVINSLSGNNIRTAKIAQLVSDYAGKMPATTQEAEIIGALPPRYGSIAKDIASLISAYAGPCQPTFGVIANLFDQPTIMNPNNNGYLNRFADWGVGRFGWRPSVRIWVRPVFMGLATYIIGTIVTHLNKELTMDTCEYLLSAGWLPSWACARWFLFGSIGNT